MKIEVVDSLVLGEAHFVRIRTDDGLTGLGQSACWAYPVAVHAVVEAFRPYLIGKNPLQIERHWQHLYRMGPFRGSILSAAVSAVDIALWDLKGKALGVPVFELLGGRYRDSLRLLYLMTGWADLDELLRCARAAIADGFTAFKFDPLPRDHYNLALPALLRRASETVAAVRNEAGDAVDLVLELHRALSPLTARALIEELHAFDPLFVEDPIQIDGLEAQGRITDRAATAVGLGERLHTSWEVRDQLSLSGPVYLRADVGLAGGISHCQKIAAVAEAFHSTVLWHSWLGPVIASASAHLNTAVPNVVLHEFYPHAEEGEAARPFAVAHERRGGELLVADVPGLGVELADDSPEPIELLGRPISDIPNRADGSVAYAI